MTRLSQEGSGSPVPVRKEPGILCCSTVELCLYELLTSLKISGWTRKMSVKNNCLNNTYFPT